MVYKLTLGIYMYRCKLCDIEYQENSFGTMIIKKNTYICPSCVKKINLMSDKSKKEHMFESNDSAHLSNKEMNYEDEHNKRVPKMIKDMLDKYVVGQEQAKKMLSIASYNHYKRTMIGDPQIQKSNILIMGPTGCGKTYLVKTLAKILGVPVAITPATNLTEAGYVGNDAETVVMNLVDAAGGDIELAQRGIIFIDEVDKLVSKSGTGARKEVGGTGVQQALLPIIEGCSVEVPLKNQRNNLGGLNPNTVTVDTSNILFICGGAFPELENIVTKRFTKTNQIGFNPEQVENEEEQSIGNFYSHVNTEDLKEFGLIPEFIGRLPVITYLDKLDKDILKRILVEPEGSLVSQYRKLFEYDELELVFEDAALDYIAEQAVAKETGARALRGIMEDVLSDLMFESPSMDDVGTIYVTYDYIIGKEQVPDYIYRSGQFAAKINI